jgi:hypothetical protein
LWLWSVSLELLALMAGPAKHLGTQNIPIYIPLDKFLFRKLAISKMLN